MNDTDPQSHPGPKIIARSDHCISRADISDNAIKVLYRLHKAGYQAFLVGGGVRDLLLGLHPKDFDVATDASPDQVKALFRNCRLIGRRFRLAHVHFGRDIIEVVTFRAAAIEEHQQREQTDDGRILRDNVYGPIEEDIWRRDFTVNALYYNIADFSVWDYTSGMADIEARTLRLIGNPETRYREDPVRMLRAARFAAKLDFEIAPETLAPIARLGPLLRDVPAARLFDEALKLFHTGHGTKSFEILLQHDLLKYLFPHTAESIEGEQGAETLGLIRAGLANTDNRVRDDQPVTPMFLYAVMLWHPIRARAEAIHEEYDVSPIEALLDACDEISSEQQGHTSYPRRFSVPMKDMLVMQRRFENRRGARAMRLLTHKRFRAAYDFLMLRARCGQADDELADFWTEVQSLSEGEQRKAFSVTRRRPRRRSRSGQQRAEAAR
ncbi:MAG TPA: polynucleotide adenylyltransferase PcnB [Gammaproteobacteria bacterium]